VQVTQYTVVEDDTLWGIAIKFGLSLDELVAANPAIEPDRVFPGDVVNVPLPGTTIIAEVTRQPTTQPPPAVAGISARVKPDADGLRLRRDPSTSDNVITKLPALTPLNPVGRTATNDWLEITLSDGTRGWVMMQYVDFTGDLALVAVSGPPVAAPPGESQPVASQSLPRDEPYISGITARAAEIYRAGQERGNRANVFALVGDSNTQNPAFLMPFDQGNYSLGNYDYLQDTIRFFRGSFGRSMSSPAAVGGFNTTKVLDPANAGGCNGGESPLACEYRITRPSVALILLGTGDQHSWQGFEGRYRTVIETTISQGIIPVLITKGDDLESKDNSAPYGYINGIIARLSREYDVPLLDLRQAIANLPNRGFESDGFHYNAPPDNKSCHFIGDAMQYGYTIRNLSALQMLDALRRQVLSN
jgi:LysM repeat protein